MPIAAALIIAMCAVLASGAVQSQAYPSKPIKFIVPFPPGGHTGSRRGSCFWGGDGVRPPGLGHGILSWVASMIIALAPFASLSADAQPYPSKPIRFIVPFPPGGGNDIVGRIVAQKLAEGFAATVVIDNRGGAGGTLGTEMAAKAPADGHTMLINNISLAVNATLFPKLPYDTLKDLAPVTLVGRQPNILVVHPS
ncbi:MAG TPA: tripartite tricarboxylate transporter substrate-binding protein, partial [Burkholderiales bacterium]|nr:tripartite tricarboxylate transporter substrate-binding protein [Burkholderiales bacterium]